MSDYKKLYDLCIVDRVYQDRNGNEKSHYVPVGAVINGPYGPYMVLEAWFNPAGVKRNDNSSSIRISMFKPKSNNDNSESSQNNSAQGDYSSWNGENFNGGNGNNDAIPF